MLSLCLHFQVKSDVTEGSTKLADVIGEDSDAVICSTGFRPSWDIFSPWKVVILNFLAYSPCISFSLYQFDVSKTFSFGVDQ